MLLNPKRAEHRLLYFCKSGEHTREVALLGRILQQNENAEQNHQKENEER